MNILKEWESSIARSYENATIFPSLFDFNTTFNIYFDCNRINFKYCMNIIVFLRGGEKSSHSLSSGNPEGEPNQMRRKHSGVGLLIVQDSSLRLT